VAQISTAIASSVVSTTAVRRKKRSLGFFIAKRAFDRRISLSLSLALSLSRALSLYIPLSLSRSLSLVVSLCLSLVFALSSSL
jgi:hypothetical protein